MRTSVSVFGLGILVAVAGMAAEPASTNGTAAKTYVQQIASEAAEARKSAQEIAAAAKDKKADLSQVSGRIADVEQRVARINELVNQLETSRGEWNSVQQADVDRLKELATLLQIFLNNKKDVASQGIGAADRTSLRNQALGVATRADLIQKTAAKL